MSIPLHLTPTILETLDLAPAHELVRQLLQDPATSAQQVIFSIDYPRALGDPRELSEIPDVRLWFVRLDATYPWIPYFLDWRQGELARYAAMLIPHQFKPKEGIQYNPEALELWLYNKMFVLITWMKRNGIGGINDLKNMALIFGFEVSDEFLRIWDETDPNLG